MRARALAHGAEGRRWLEELPERVAALALRWGLEIGPAYSGGTAGLVLAAADGGGRPCVLKVAMRLESDLEGAFGHAVRAHEIAAGRGCARIYEHDAAAGALLLERLGPSVADLDLPLPHLLEAIAATLCSFWRPLPEAEGLVTGAAKAVWLAEFVVAVWEELGRPCDRSIIDRALRYCDERAAAFDPATSVLVHGDAHGWNTLVAGDGYKFVDPEGVQSERAHDLAVPMREYNEPLLCGDTARLARERAELLAGWCEVDPEAVWQWGFVERVSTGLANLRDFGAANGVAFLEVARRCLV